MLPKVIIHNSISLDGSLTNFEADLWPHKYILTLGPTISQLRLTHEALCFP